MSLSFNTSSNTANYPPAHFHGWKVLALCTLCQFASIGCTMYLIGVFVPALSEAWSISPGKIGAGAALFAVAGAILSPLLGYLSDRNRARQLMLAGSILMSLGFLLLSQVQSALQALLVVGLLLAPGSALLGSIPTTVMVAQWFAKRRGMAIGITVSGISIGGFIMPMVAAQLLLHLGWQGALMSIGIGIGAILIPTVYWIAANKPADVGTYPDADEHWQAASSDQPDASNSSAEMSLGQILSNKDYWLITLCIGSLSFLGVFAVTYISPYGKEAGLSLTHAALMVSLYSAAGIAGKFGLGWLCDKFSPKFMLTFTLLIVAAGWVVILLNTSLAGFLLAAALVGFGMGGMLPVWSSLVALLFGLANFGKVRGVMGLGLIVFTFLPGPLGGYLHDSTGTYLTAFRYFLWILPVGVAASLLVSRPSVAGSKQ